MNSLSSYIANKTFIGIIIWLSSIYGFAILGIGELFVILSGIIFIFFNLGERKGVSAYSVFNDGCKKILGTSSASDLINQQTGQRKSTSKPEDYVEPSFIVRNQRLRNKPCPCGSGKKHKKCCLYAPEQDPED
ncbi:unnamed protein product [Blepharisma stoltei]|uniref:SAYSvFN domain-containing protein n=1 Tax=Blepharisma stoltei TaxID=1481888 RepID=A0AAU9IW08_9CILI|nr:unnamed protein product [Blepharisma stoltei]